MCSFSQCEKITNNDFTGTAYFLILVEADSLTAMCLGNVTFEPSARTKWCSIPARQIILEREVVGYYEEKCPPKKSLHKGDTGEYPPIVVHWHGASEESKCVQLAIIGNQIGTPVSLESVTDQRNSINDRIGLYLL